jgi:pimeloyl-ACP methyl ester carboxylesterase
MTNSTIEEMPSSFHNRKISIGDFDLNASYLASDGYSGTIVYLHDSLGCISLWRDFPQRLGNTVQANSFIYDRRGYGLSSPFDGTARQTDYMEKEAEQLIVLLDQCGIEHPVLFGHSDGGTIALLAAAKYPQRIKAVITEGAHVFVEEITLDGIVRAKEQYTMGLKERLEKYHGHKTQALFEAWTETWLSDAYRDWNIEHFLPQIQCPVLVIQGTEDEYGSTEQVASIVRHTSGPAESCMIQNAGHSPHKQSEHWVIDRCYTFLDKHSLITI